MVPSNLPSSSNASDLHAGACECPKARQRIGTCIADPADQPSTPPSSSYDDFTHIGRRARAAAHPVLINCFGQPYAMPPSLRNRTQVSPKWPKCHPMVALPPMHICRREKFRIRKCQKLWTLVRHQSTGSCPQIETTRPVNIIQKRSTLARPRESDEKSQGLRTKVE